jgi:hypothetical protein
MADDTEQPAPDLGDPTDAEIGDETAVFLMRGAKPPRKTVGAGVDETERTQPTPDRLGGTGGAQSGGAG